jgi:hypothetical protein
VSNSAMIPDHPIISRLMRDGELGPNPPLRCKECSDGIWEGDTSYGGRCEICFHDWLRFHLDEAAEALGVTIITVEE